MQDGDGEGEADVLRQLVRIAAAHQREDVYRQREGPGQGNLGDAQATLLGEDLHAIKTLEVLLAAVGALTIAVVIAFLRDVVDSEVYAEVGRRN